MERAEVTKSSKIVLGAVIGAILLPMVICFFGFFAWGPGQGGLEAAGRGFLILMACVVGALFGVVAGGMIGYWHDYKTRLAESTKHAVWLEKAKGSIDPDGWRKAFQ